MVKLKEKVHVLRMEDKQNDEEYEISEEDFSAFLKKFESKKSATYDFITKAGLSFQLAILKLCRRLIKEETFPSRFNITTLIQLPKKGSAQELDNRRFIHTKEWLARLVEALTVQPMKAEIFARYQIGGCPGKRTVFNLFAVKSNIALKLLMGGGVILTLLDLVRFLASKANRRLRRTVPSKSE